MDSVREVTDLDAARRPRSPTSRSRPSAPDLWDDPDAGAAGHQSRCPAPTPSSSGSSAWTQRIDDLETLVEMGTEDGGDADTLAEAERELAALKKDVGELEVRTLLVGRVRRARGGRHDPLRRRRRRRRRLRRDADADVPALGRAARLPDEGHGHLLRRGGRAEVGDLRGQRALRVRHLSRRGRHAPAGADQPVRQPGPAPDELRRRRGASRSSRATDSHRDPRERDQGRRLPLVAAPAASASTRPTPPCG